MNYTKFLATLKKRVWYLDKNNDGAFHGLPADFFDTHIEKALNKFTVNAGKSRFFRPATNSKVIQFNEDDKIHTVIHAYVRRSASTMAPQMYPDPFNINDLFFSDSFLINQNVQSYILTRSFYDTFSQYMGVTDDWYFDDATLTLYINDRITDMTGMYFEYLPEWYLDSADDTVHINDKEVLEWLFDYSIESIKFDVYVMLTSGGNFDIPADASAFSSSEEKMETLIEECQERFPYIGLDRG